MSTLRLGVADHIDDLHRVFEICEAAGVTVIPEDGSGSAGYAFSIQDTEWDRARAALTAAALFRSGDLRVFLFDTRMASDQKLTKEDHAIYHGWRLSQRKQDTLAKTSGFDSKPEQNQAPQPTPLKRRG